MFKNLNIGEKMPSKNCRNAQGGNWKVMQGKSIRKIIPFVIMTQFLSKIIEKLVFCKFRITG